MSLLESRFRLFVAVTLVRLAFLAAIVVSVGIGVGLPLSEMQLTVLEHGVQLVQFVGWLAFLSGFSDFLDAVRGKQTPPASESMVVSHFIPILHLYKPAAALNRSIDELERLAERFRGPTTKVYAFWACWLGHTISSRFLGSDVDAAWVAFVVCSFGMLGGELLIASSVVATSREVATIADQSTIENVATVFR